MLKIKDNVDLKELEKFGFELEDDNYKKQIKGGEISINNKTRNLYKYKFDRTTYTGYAYTNEYNQTIKPYIQDLIKADMVEKVEE